MNSDSVILLNSFIMESYKHDSALCLNQILRRMIMWTTPAATEMRFGFEVTMYVMNK